MDGVGADLVSTNGSDKVNLLLLLFPLKVSCPRLLYDCMFQVRFVPACFFESKVQATSCDQICFFVPVASWVGAESRYTRIAGLLQYRADVNQWCSPRVAAATFRWLAGTTAT